MRKIINGILFLLIVSACGIGSVQSADTGDRITSYADCRSWVLNGIKKKDARRGTRASRWDKAASVRLNCGRNQEDWKKRIQPRYTYEGEVEGGRQ